MNEHNVKRQSNFELLRIVAMIMIVFQHFAYHSNFDWQSVGATVPHLWCNLIAMGGQVGVDLFVLISGYFLINSSGSVFNFKRILKLWGQILFYSVGLYLVLGILGFGDFRKSSLILSFFPVTRSSWWFASAYFVLYIIHPFLNLFLRSLKKELYQSLLVMLIVMWSVIPTFTSSSFGSNDLLWFCTLYAIAGYAGLYGFNSRFNVKHHLILCMVTAAFTYASSVFFTLLSVRRNEFSAYITWFYKMEKITILLMAVTLFLAFAAWKMKYHKWINILASATFGIYLIHDQSLVRYLLWERICRAASYQDSLFLIPYSLGAVAAVYIVCTIIDLIRKQIFEKPYMYLVNRYADTVLRPFTGLSNALKKIIFG